MALAPISRAAVEATKKYIWSKDRLPYAYGGSGNPGGDCSWFSCAGVAHLLGMRANQRYGSTENFNTRGSSAYGIAAQLGLVQAGANRSAVPYDAVIKVGFMHGGGGYDSHVSTTIDGLNFESRGLYRGRSGHVVADSARAWNDGLFHNFWYLPRTVGPTNPDAWPLPDGYVYGWYSGPEWMISGRAGEQPAWIEALKRCQRALGVPATGVYDDATHLATKRAQERAAGLLPDGFIGPRTWELLIEGEKPLSAAEVHDIKQFIAAFCGPIGHDVKRIAVQHGLAADDKGFSNVPGLPQLGNRSLADAVAAIGDAVEVPRAVDLWKDKDPRQK